jgi:hypothetical protein
MYIAHGDSHPTRGKTKKERAEFLKKVAKKARQDGRLWKLQHMNTSQEETRNAISKYHGPYDMDDERSLIMVKKFEEGIRNVVSLPELGWDINDLNFLIHLKDYKYRKAGHDFIIIAAGNERTYSNSYHGIQNAMQDMLGEFEEVIFG